MKVCSSHVKDKRMHHDLGREAVEKAMDAIVAKAQLIEMVEGAPSAMTFTINCAISLFAGIVGMACENSPQPPAMIVGTLGVDIIGALKEVVNTFDEHHPPKGDLLYIIAGSRDEAWSFAADKELASPDFRLVNRADNIVGLQKFKYVLVGQYWKLPEWDAIKQQLHFCREALEIRAEEMKS